MEILGITIPTWVAVAVPGVYLLYRYLTRDFDFFAKQGIKGPRPYPVVGTILTFLYHSKKGLMQYDVDLRRRYGPVVGGFTGSRPSLLVGDPEIVKEILVKQFSLFQNRQAIEFNESPIDQLLSLLRDDQWKHVRTLLTPTFSGSRLRKMTDIINKCAVSLRDSLVDTCVKGESFDIKASASNFTMDAIAGTAFGIDLDSQKDPHNQFVAMANKSVFRDIKDPRLIIMLFMPKLARFLSKLGVSFFPRDVTAFFTKVTNDAIKHRGEHPEIQAKDFLFLMITATGEDPDGRDGVDGTPGVIGKTKLTHGEILAQALLFFIAGFETTALTLSYLAYNLALNQDKQDKLLEEIDSVMAGKDEVDYDMCTEMSYLSMCIDETLRMYPAVTRLDRQASHDVTIKGVHIRKGMTVFVPVYGMHHDPELWEDPETFTPERFTAKPKASRDPYTYMPFGLGPRSCIGIRLALVEIKIVMATILKGYRFVKCDETEIPVKMSTVSVSPVNGIKLKLETRR